MRLPNKSIIKDSNVDGPGTRTVLFTQGCSIRCAGCQSVHLWPRDEGIDYHPGDIACALIDASRVTKNITISGGEPFDQVKDLADLVEILKFSAPTPRHIIVYTGYTWEELRSRCRDPEVGVYYQRAIAAIDVIVDGPYIKEQDNDWIGFRGSANQRPIDVRATLASPDKSLAVLDWDDTIIIVDDGDVLAPVGFSDLLHGLGTSERSRLCGQSKGHTSEL